MRYEMMFPVQIRKAIQESWPVVIPVGVLEYHAEHLAVGTDTLVITKALDLLESEMDMVVLPPFYYGAASYAVESPEDRGTVQVNAKAIYFFARDLFLSLLRVGFRNIHVFSFHQSENFTAGMPTDLALKLGAREMIFNFLEDSRGEGWWGKESMRNYYAEHVEESDPFSWIRFHPFMDEETFKKFPADHAGLLETSLMMAFCPDGVDMKLFSPGKWYSESAVNASAEYGNAAKQMILDGMRRILKPK